jgi:hypothetical protein
MSPIPWFDQAAIPSSRPAYRQSAARKHCPGCRLRHCQRRRAASWTVMSTALNSIASDLPYRPSKKIKISVDKGWKVLTRHSSDDASHRRACADLSPRAGRGCASGGSAVPIQSRLRDFELGDNPRAYDDVHGIVRRHAAFKRRRPTPACKGAPRCRFRLEAWRGGF